MRLPKTSGSIHLIPLLVVALVLSIFVVNSFGYSRGSSSVLSQGSDSGSSGSSGSGSSGSSDDEDDDRSGTSGSPTPVPTARPLLFRLLNPSTPEPEDEVEDEIEEDEEIENDLQDEIDARRRVEIREEEGRIKIRVRVGNQTRELEIRPEETRARFKIEENGVENSVTIRVRGDRFVITHEGVEAETRFPLTVDPVTNTLMVNTPAGLVNVVTLPATAVENMLATGRFDEAGDVEIEEGDEENEAVFRIKGVNNLKLLGIVPIAVPVESLVGAQTGEVLEVNEPLLLRLFRFLFTE